MPKDDKENESIFEKIDLMDQPVLMKYNGKKSHSTKCGGLLSIIICGIIFAILVSKLWILIGYLDDEYDQFVQTHDP